jgi:CRP/FNR family transcriptional regulator
MFCNLDEAALLDFNALGEQALVPPGTHLFRESDPGHAVFVLCTGQVKLSCTSRDGRTMILKLAMPGDVLGLSAVLSGTPFEVTAQTMEPTQIKSIDRAAFLGFLQRHGEASLHAAQALSADYNAAFFDVRRLALSATSAGRLAAVLLDWGRTAACTQPDMRFPMSLTHEELANLVGTSRETVTRTLGKFKRDGLIAIEGPSIRILAPEALEELSA